MDKKTLKLIYQAFNAIILIIHKPDSTAARENILSCISYLEQALRTIDEIDNA